MKICLCGCKRKTNESHDFIHGHNQRGKKSGKNVPCQVCNVIFYVIPARLARTKTCSKKCRKTYLKNLPPETTSNWRGGRYIDFSGYVRLTINKKQVPEHRYLIEKYLGRTLKKEEVVHHINGDKQDNRIKNLIVMTRKIHMKHHDKERKKTNSGKYV